jgi:hypothetical protein
MNDSNNISIIVAIVAALSSLVVAGISYLSARKNTHDLESLKADLAEKQAEKNARRDYEYEARKRLYQQYEPLLFQLVELSESALGRISGFARSARQNNLGPDHPGWLTPGNYYYDYYMASTIYRLLAPFAIIKLIQRLLTLVDLTVDPHINNQYSLAKWLYLSFTEDFALARRTPELEYDPNDEEWREKRERNPKKYYRQGVFAGVLDNAVETLIVSDSNGIMRCMSFGEFERIYKGDTKFDAFIELFQNFHPKMRPVLWRILIDQAHIYKALLRTREMKLTSSKERQTAKLLAPLSEKERLDFDWRQSNEKGTDEEISEDAVS